MGSGFPECKALDVGFVLTELTGPPDGLGPQTPENAGAVSFVVLKLDGALMLPPEGAETVCKVRVTGTFPEHEGEERSSRVFFTTLSNGRNVPPQVYVGNEIPITRDRGNPVLMLEDCVVTLKSSSVAAFVRCDSNDDGVATLSDAVWTLNDLFLAGPATPCRAAADCDGNGLEDLSDAVFLLVYLFRGGSPPSRPFPVCDRIDTPVEQCPPGSTVCP